MAAKKRGNGQGTAYKENGTWRACIVLGYEPVEMPDGTVRMIVHRKRKRGFPTKSAALAYCESLRKQSLQIRLLNFLDLYKEWESGYAGRVSKSTIVNRDNYPLTILTKPITQYFISIVVSFKRRMMHGQNLCIHTKSIAFSINCITK